MPRRGKKLPDYRGALSPAPWSALRLTDEAAATLRSAALRGCPQCLGAGYYKRNGAIHACHCVNRPPNPDSKL